MNFNSTIFRNKECVWTICVMSEESVACNSGSDIYLCHLRTKQLTLLLPKVHRRMCHCILAFGKNHLASGGCDNENTSSLKLWNLETKKFQEFKTNSSPTIAICVGKKKIVYGCMFRSQIGLIEFSDDDDESYSKPDQKTLHEARYGRIVVLEHIPGRNIICVASNASRELILLDLKGTLLCLISIHSSPQHVIFLPAEERGCGIFHNCVFAVERNGVYAYKLNSNAKMICRVDSDTMKSEPSLLTLDKNRGLLFISYENLQIEIVDLNTFSLSSVSQKSCSENSFLKGHVGPITTMKAFKSFRGDMVLCSGSMDGSVRIWADEGWRDREERIAYTQNQMIENQMMRTKFVIQCYNLKISLTKPIMFLC